ncbi:MAG TPA: penicillin-binding protein [Candidatus Moranbacteria bacterium]|nr:MAG: Penicillin-binding protein, 1A family [Parcubacteria group bacterium GW2011_GWC1_45_14]HAV11216.1 penicillin-binding protein [Candidatus Moranbacteria bacterium]
MKINLIPRSFKRTDESLDWKKIGKIFGVLAGIGFLAVAGVFIYFAKDLPSPGKVNKRVVAESTKIYDRTGQNLLYEIHGEEKRTLVALKDIPDTAKFATISLEDQDFYKHHGIKVTSIIRAVLKDVISGERAQGGSTITQQFVKNSLLTSEKALTRKIKEAILSIEIEQKFSKDEILEMYLNEIPYGSNAYGIESAAQTFFNKPAKELTLDESALLASLPQAPSRYSPYGSRTEILKARQEFALDKMANLGYITKEQAEAAKGVDVLAKVTAKRENIKAPHFVMYVKEYLEGKYGQDVLEKGGLKVYTTLDWDKQQIAEKAVFEGAEKNMKAWNASNAALVAIDPKTGQILTMVGSKDYFDKSIDGQVNVAIRDRQPGSSVKPYVYLTAFTKGYSPETTLFDVETNFGTGDQDYKPQNYDGNFRGPIKMKEALPQSLNIPAVKTLYLAGVKDSIMMAKRLGITGLNQPDRYGLSLVLGGGEVKLLDHVSAFATIANNGVRKEKSSILRIEDSKGEVLEEYKDSQGERIVEEKYVAMLSHVLSTNEYRAPVFGSNNLLRFDDRQVAAKTGTTNEFRDGWVMGYTPGIAVGVWAGNNDNTAMKPGADGSIIAAPIWRSYLDQVLKNYAKEEFPKYEKEKIEKPVLNGELAVEKDVKVCEIPDSDEKYCLANEYCPSDDVEKIDFANVHNILYYVNLKDPLGEYPKNPKDDAQYKNWEKGVEEWYSENNKKEKDVVFGEAPKDKCSQDDFSENLPKVSLSISKSDTELSVSANADAPYGTESIRFSVDGNAISSSGSKANYSIPADKVGESVDVKVILRDKNGNETQDSKSVTL